MELILQKIKTFIKDSFRERNIVYTLSLIVLFCSLFFTLLTFLIYKGETFKLFFGSVPGDQFGDSFNPIEAIKRVGITHVYDDPTYPTASYPPLAILVIGLMCFFIPNSDLQVSRESASYYFMVFFYTAVCLILIILLLYKMCGGLSKKFRITFIVITMISPTFIYLYLRGNLLLLCLVLLMFFLAFYNSERRWLRELSIGVLSVAIGIKIYPIVFCGLLLCEKRYKDLLKVFYYTIALYLIPFLCLGGIYQAKQLLANMSYASSHFGKEALLAGPATLLNFSNTFIWFVSLFGVDKNTLLSIANYILYPFVTLIVIFSFFVKEKWKKLFCYSLIAIMIPAYSWLYTDALYLIPFVFLLIKSDYKKIDIIYAVEFSILFSSFVFIDKVFLNYSYDNADFASTGYIYQVTQYIVLFTIVVDEIIMLVQHKKKHLDVNNQVLQ